MSEHRAEHGARPIGSVVALWRYPVKSMAGERLEVAAVGTLPCAGVFAEVAAPGVVRIGDEITVVQDHFASSRRHRRLVSDTTTTTHTPTRSTTMKSTQADLDTIMESEVATLKGTQWGEMAVNINRFEPGADLSPLLAQVSTGSCPVPHWGYLIEGSWTVGYTDGSTETINAGEVFYLPSGHDRVFTETGCLMAEFSPAAENAAFMEEVAPLLAE